MKLFGPLPRIVALAGLLAVTPMAAAPAMAAQADVALLKSYLGSWKGRGPPGGGAGASVVVRRPRPARQPHPGTP